jgi:hypothetical protein
VDYHPGLICRTYPGDVGVRPLPVGTIFYESPDIWVVAPDNTGVPIVGVKNQVNVHVWNNGVAPAYGVLVELYWCDPSVGVSLALATQIGTTQQIVLQAGQHAVLTFDWTPVLVNNGHECLVAQVYDPVSDNLVAPFNPVLDRHVAQHNINQVRVQAGQQIKLPFTAPNLSDSPAETAIQFQQIRGDSLQTIGQALGIDSLPEGTQATATIHAVQLRPIRPRINIADHPVTTVFREALEPLPRSFDRKLLEAALLAIPKTLVAGKDLVSPVELSVVREVDSLLTHNIPPGTELLMTLEVTLPKEARKGTYHAYRVIEQSNGRITGGITYLLQVN